MHGEFQPMALGSAKAPFSHPDWLFELKYDGFRALAHIDGKRTQLVSRNGHPFASFSDLGHAIATALPYTQLAVLDVFFFSSRRRHTRSLRDWSSDVCSSDLIAFVRRNDERDPSLINEGD